jgi:D-hexose-6-phosphate mutarotase
VPGVAGDSSVKMDFGLSDGMLDEATRAKWPHSFGLTYTVALSPGELQTSMLVRNTGETSWEFNVLLHTYLRIDVSFQPSFDRHPLHLPRFPLGEHGAGEG